MRSARPVGLTDDGRFLIVETADGQTISVPADDQLRTALRYRPRPHLETEMEQSMTPREIQMKLRAGASVEELAGASGMPIARVEAFAAPVLAERNHIAGLAQLGSVRRAGETTGHRTLRAAVNERLKEHGVDPEDIEWDSYKMDDGRWSITASYQVQRAGRVAVFYFDQRGRFSVSGNDEGRWAIGEQAEAAEADQVRIEQPDNEPTLKLASPADELALLRAVETDEPTLEPDEEPGFEGRQHPDVVAVPDAAPQPADEAEEPSQINLLYDLLGSDGYAEDSIRVFEGLSDATAVPDVADNAWQDAEAEEEDAEAEPAQPEIFADGAAQETLPETEPEQPARLELQPEPEPEPEPEAEAKAEPVEPEEHAAASTKSKKRRRASVPSWDEIMFGSPGPKSK